MMPNLFLIAAINGTEVAISSSCVESVVAVGEIFSVPRSDPLIAGLMALRSRVLTLIDCRYAVTGAAGAGENSSLAVIANVMGHPYALLVDSVSDVISVDEQDIRPANKLPSSWAKVVDQVIEFDGRIIMQFSPDLLLTSNLALAA